MSKIIIIGGNAAGPAAAAKAKRVNPKSEVILLEASEYISTGTCEMPYVLSGDIESYNDIIFFNPKKFKEEKGVDVLVNHFVDGIDKKKKEITALNTETGKRINLEYDKLILATGSKPIILSKYSIFKNTFSFKSIGDLIKIKKYIENNSIKNVSVIGAGYIGLELIDALSKLEVNITLFEKSNLPLEGSENIIQKLVENILIMNNITYYGNSNAVEVIADDDKISGLKLDAKIIPTDFVIVAVGLEPNTDLVKKFGINIGQTGAIKVNNKLCTCNQHIYAAGDNMEVINYITKRPDYIPLASLAHLAGHIAGENAAGGNKFMDSVVKNISVKIFDYYYINVGMTENELNNYQYNFLSVSSVEPNLITVMPETKNIFGKIIYDKNSRVILGASFWGGKEVSGYGDLISTLIRLKEPASILSKINFNYTPPLSPMKNILSILGRRIK